MPAAVCRLDRVDVHCSRKQMHAFSAAKKAAARQAACDNGDLDAIQQRLFQKVHKRIGKLRLAGYMEALTQHDDVWKAEGRCYKCDKDALLHGWFAVCPLMHRWVVRSMTHSACTTLLVCLVHFAIVCTV
jgi:hypothetical protein